MPNLNKPIEVRMLKEAEDYILGLDEKIQIKFLKIFERVQLGIRGDWFKKLKDSVMVYSNSSTEASPNFIESLHFGIQLMRIP